MTARISPATEPFAPGIGEQLVQVMRGRPPLSLFTTLARDPRLFGKFFAGSLLDRGHLTLRQREIVIHRTTALCRSEYEWGVHVSAFARHVGFTDDQIRAFVQGSADDACWDGAEALLIRWCDALHRDCDVDDRLWNDMKAHHSDEAIIELLMLAGFYRTVSYLTNALRLPLEAGAARFPPQRMG